MVCFWAVLNGLGGLKVVTWLLTSLRISYATA
jgi:hypothetical protein